MIEDLPKFVENLDALMFDCGVDVPQLAETLGMNETTFYKFFSMSRQPSVETLVRLADHFGCSVDFLLGRAPERSAGPFRPCPPFSDRLKELLSGVNVSKFCRELPVTRSVLYAWLSGKSVPSLDYLVRLADRFGRTTDEILGRER